MGLCHRGDAGHDPRLPHPSTLRGGPTGPADSIPTIFFSVIFYYFSNYTYDAVLLTLAAIAAITYADRAARALSGVAGVATALAFLAKPTFLAFAVLIPLAGIASARLIRPDRATRIMGGRRRPTGGSSPSGLALAFLIVAGALALLQARLAHSCTRHSG